MKERTELIEVAGKCVVGNIKFPGLSNTSYTAQDIVAGLVTEATLKRMWTTFRKKLATMEEEDDLFNKNPKSSKLPELLRTQIEFIECYVKYTDAKKEMAFKRAETLKANAAKKEAIKNIIAEKEIDGFVEKSLDDLKKLLEEL